ncbi:hypothetical protein [Tsukamurella soli]|uniref:Uncharacterized protein n=1 Tax=Tsukamurella soli TaxID=644556 RepID=A0ABP8KJ35_9ACTN
MNAPLPGQHLPSRAPLPAVDVDPAQIRAAVEDLLHGVDEIQARGADTGPGADDGAANGTGALAALGRQSALLEQAHRVLVDALDRVDRA